MDSHENNYTLNNRKNGKQSIYVHAGVVAASHLVFALIKMEERERNSVDLQLRLKSFQRNI